MRIATHILAAASVALSALLSLGCGDSTQPIAPPPPPPPPGQIVVTATTEGVPSGNGYYVILVDGNDVGTIDQNGTAMIPLQPVGRHSVQLSLAPSNCAFIAAGNPQPVDVVSDQASTVKFSVLCSEPYCNPTWDIC